MKYEWLEKLAEDGHIRPEALAKIYQNCEHVLEQEKLAMDPLALAKQMSLMMGMQLGGLAVMGAVGAGANHIGTIIKDQRMQQQTDINKAKILKSPRLLTAKDREKAEARFNEILKFAPSLGPNEAVMTKMVMDKLYSGLTNQDVQNLISMQIKITPDPLQYSAMSSQVKTAAEKAGELFADLCVGIEKQADWKGVAGHIARTLSVPLGLSAAVGGAQYVKSKIDENSLRKQMENSFMTALHSDEVLQANPEKAKEAFAILTHFAPHIASEPTAAKTFMNRIVSYSQGPNATDLKDLTEVEKNMGASRMNMFDVLDKSMNMSGVPRILSKTWGETVAPYQVNLNNSISRNIYKANLGAGVFNG